MRCFLRLASLALALWSIPAAAAAQRIPFPDGKGWVGQGLTLPLTWGGKPALLVTGTHGTFLSYDSQPQAPVVPTPVFTIVAAYFMDRRPCAVQPWSGNGLSGPTSEPCLNVGFDHGSLGSFGGLAPDGTLLWTRGGLWHTRLAFESWRDFASKPYHIEYRLDPQHTPRTACSPNTGPEFVAMVLVIEGLGT